MEFVTKLVSQPVATKSDLTLVVIFSLGLYLLRGFIERMVLWPMTVKWGFTKDIGRKKFLENGWYFLYYPTLLSIGVYLLWDKPWFFCRSEHYFDPNIYNDWNVYPGLRIYYLFQMSFYIQGLISLVTPPFDLF